MKTRLLLPALFIFTAAATFAAESDNGFTVHEWGTFTSVQGADGVQMIWNPLTAPELPKFVYNQAAYGTYKIAMATRQRMETPVIYFYSDRARTVDVAVRFPEGRVTEWFPDPAATERIKATYAVAKDPPALHWKEVRIAPSEESAALPVDKSGSHYYAARETDASLLRITTPDQKIEAEKFLFYRGVAGFIAPLTVKLGGDGANPVSLSNTGQEDLQNLFLYEVRADGGVSWMTLGALAPGATHDLDLSQATGAGAETLAAALRSALVSRGLYEKEAAAMVKTWESAWFRERGRRVLYLLPRAWTDRTLPLAITSAPKSVERVMVARAEIITPAMEGALLQEIERYMAAKPKDRWKIVAETRALGLGRFSDVVLRRLFVGVTRSAEFSSLSQELLQAASAPPRLDVTLNLKTLTKPGVFPDSKSLNK